MFQTVWGTWRAPQNINYCNIIEGEIEELFSSQSLRIHSICPFPLLPPAIPFRCLLQSPDTLYVPLIQFPVAPQLSSAMAKFFNL